jgi:Domain of unknown function (DUF4388)
MLLPGRLRATTLGDLLGALYRARATGTLELVETGGATSGRRHRVHLDAGLVEHVDTPLTVPKLGEILRREGFVSDETTRAMLRRSFVSPGKRLGELLIEASAASVHALGAALRYQQRARLDALFALGDAFVQFHVMGARRAEALDHPLSPREFLFGRRRARDRPNARPQASPRRERPAASRARHEPTRARALDMLGLGAGADRDAVQRAFRARAREVHPDRFPQATAVERAELMRRFAALSAAYHLLLA